MRLIISAALGLWLALVGSSLAQSGNNNAIVVELYTSQGCSSCPPADAVLADLATRDGVIALALHVDYWDYIGWKDTLANPANTKRQRAYAQVAGARTIYTPQMIVGGMDHVVGAHRSDVEKLIAAHAAKPRLVSISLARQGRKFRLSARADKPLPRGAIVQLIRYIPLVTIAIGRGENAGRTINYANTVAELKQIAKWDGRNALSLEFEASGEGAFVVVIQEPGPGPVLAAAHLP